MKRLFLLGAILTSTLAFGQTLNWTPLLQQNGIYYSSERVTAGGLGIGAGVRFDNGAHLVGQTDFSLLWINGNAVSTRFALGYQRDGRWSPALLGTFGLLFGQRTEILSETGERPKTPVWILGLRAAPLSFQGERGFVSALEVGYGFGPYKGTSLEVTILSAGIRW